MRWSSAVVLLVVLGVSLQASAANEWDKNSRRCMESFRNYDSVGLRELYECVALWEAYRSPSSVKQAEKLVALQAFNFLCANGEEEESYLAEQAIYRLGDSPRDECLKRGSAGPAVGPGTGVTHAQPEKAQPEPTPEPLRRVVYDPPSVAKAQHERARKYNGQGINAAKKGKDTEALKHYESAIQADPRYEMAIYNAACIYARTDQASTAIEYLRRLRDLGTDDSIDRLRKARMDGDFSSIRDRDEFKDLTGYARIKLCNSKGEYGEEEVERLEEYLAKAEYPIYDTCEYPQDLQFPVIFFRMGPARNTAVVLSGLLNHPEAQLQEVTEQRDWDIAIVWGDRYATNPRTGEPQPKSREFKDPEKELGRVRQEEDKALREPEKYARETEYRARTPERVKSNVDSNIQRVESTKDTFERAGKTTEKVFNMGK